MKAFKKAVAIVLVLLMVFAFGGCSALVQLFEKKEMRANTETMLDSVIADDFDSAYAVVDDICTEEAFVSVFSELKGMLADVDSYELSILSAHQNSNINGGETVNFATASYKMTTDAAIYIVDVQMTSVYEGLTSFYITPYEKTDYFGIGTLENMEGATTFQWIMLLSNIIIIGIAVFAFVDCCRSKIKLKVLWLIIIFLGYVTVGVTLGASSFNFNFNIGWIFTYSAYITYGGGTNVFRIMLPVGAIIYLALRKSMIRKALVRERAALAHEELQSTEAQSPVSNEQSVNQ